MAHVPPLRPRLPPRQNVPVANAKPEDIQDLLGGALFKAIYKWMLESGPVYLLPTGGRACPPACLPARLPARLPACQRALPPSSPTRAANLAAGASG